MFLSSLTRTQRAVALLFGATACVAIIVDCGGEGEAPPTTSSSKLQVTVKPAAASLDTPLDAVPEPMGTAIYYIATSKGEKGVFKVPVVGGQIVPVLVGAPLVDPHGLTISADGATVYVADPGANGGKGVIFQVPANGDTPSPLTGTEGTHPTALDMIDETAGEMIYFTGKDEADEPAIFKIGSDGGTATELAHGEPLVKPDGIIVTSKQTVFVADQEAGKGEPGQVFQLQNGALSVCGPEFVPGNPTGIADTLDEKTAIVSSLDPQKGTSQVVVLDLAGHTAGTFSDVIKENTYSGGVHRARYKNLFAWAGKTTVYSVSIKRLQVDSSTIGGPGTN
ncbi:MAG: hypothetical protein U0359_16195 [Byssovorax sp.]